MFLNARRVLLGPIVILSSLVGSPCYGQDAGGLEKVFSDWQRRREQVRAVRYTAEGQGVFPKGRFTNATDHVFDKKLMILFDFANNRYRDEEQKEEFLGASGFFVTCWETSILNGNTFKIHTLRRPPKGKEMPSALPPSDTIVLNNANSKQSLAGYVPIHFAHGSIPTVQAPLRCEGGLILPDPKVFLIHGRAMLGGRSCLVLRTQALEDLSGGFTELWVDEEHDSAVLRAITSFLQRSLVQPKQRAFKSRYQVWIDTDVTYRKTPNGWLPASWIKTSYDPSGGKVSEVERMRVLAVDMDPVFSSTDFEVESSTGTRIREFQVGPDGRSSERDMKVFQVGEDGSLIQVTGPRPTLYWLWSLAIVLLAVLVAGGWYVRRKRGQRSGEGGA